MRAIGINISVARIMPRMKVITQRSNLSNCSVDMLNSQARALAVESAAYTAFLLGSGLLQCTSLMHS